MDEFPLYITPGKKANIEKAATEYKGKSLNKETGEELLDKKSGQLSDLQELFYADGRWSVLIILQGMDASGKDSCVKRIFSGINPQGCSVANFKAPTQEELRHDFMWRCIKELPEQGKIGIFNRSYYEEVLVVRMYKKILAAENLPKESLGKDLWKNRFRDINHFEEYLSRNGTRIIKFYLHISKEEQANRLLKRALDPQKYWKVGTQDIQVNKDYHKFIPYVNDMLTHTSTKQAPWYLVPADDKWYAHLLMMNVIIREIKSLKSKFPLPTPEQEAAITEAKKVLGKNLSLNKII